MYGYLSGLELVRSDELTETIRQRAIDLKALRSYQDIQAGLRAYQSGVAFVSSILSAINPMAGFTVGLFGSVGNLIANWIAKEKLPKPYELPVLQVFNSYMLIQGNKDAIAWEFHKQINEALAKGYKLEQIIFIYLDVLRILVENNNFFDSMFTAPVLFCTGHQLDRINMEIKRIQDKYKYPIYLDIALRSIFYLFEEIGAGNITICKDTKAAYYQLPILLILSLHHNKFKLFFNILKLACMHTASCGLYNIVKHEGKTRYIYKPNVILFAIARRLRDLVIKYNLVPDREIELTVRKTYPEEIADWPIKYTYGTKTYKINLRELFDKDLHKRLTVRRKGYIFGGGKPIAYSWVDKDIFDVYPIRDVITGLKRIQKKEKEEYLGIFYHPFGEYLDRKLFLLTGLEAVVVAPEIFDKIWDLAIDALNTRKFRYYLFTTYEGLNLFELVSAYFPYVWKFGPNNDNYNLTFIKDSPISSEPYSPFSEHPRYGFYTKFEHYLAKEKARIGGIPENERQYNYVSISEFKPTELARTVLPPSDIEIKAYSEEEYEEKDETNKEKVERELKKQIVDPTKQLGFKMYSWNLIVYDHGRKRLLNKIKKVKEGVFENIDLPGVEIEVRTFCSTRIGIAENPKEDIEVVRYIKKQKDQYRGHCFFYECGSSGESREAIPRSSIATIVSNVGILYDVLFGEGYPDGFIYHGKYECVAGCLYRCYRELDAQPTSGTGWKAMKIARALAQGYIDYIRRREKLLKKPIERPTEGLPEQPSEGEEKVSKKKIIGLLIGLSSIGAGAYLLLKKD